MSWHIPEPLAQAYVAGDVQGARAASVEAHVMACDDLPRTRRRRRPDRPSRGDLVGGRGAGGRAARDLGGAAAHRRRAAGDGCATGRCRSVAARVLVHRHSSPSWPLRSGPARRVGAERSCSSSSRPSCRCSRSPARTAHGSTPPTRSRWRAPTRRCAWCCCDRRPSRWRPVCWLLLASTLVPDVDVAAAWLLPCLALVSLTLVLARWLPLPVAAGAVAVAYALPLLAGALCRRAMCSTSSCRPHCSGRHSPSASLHSCS